jgi:hypothetical protein
MLVVVKTNILKIMMISKNSGIIYTPLKNSTLNIGN